MSVATEEEGKSGHSNAALTTLRKYKGAPVHNFRKASGGRWLLENYKVCFGVHCANAAQVCVILREASLTPVSTHKINRHQ